MMSEEPCYFLLKALSNELSTLVMWVVDGRFAHYIMNMLTVVNRLGTFMMWIVK
jgi:hypothetical protein